MRVVDKVGAAIAGAVLAFSTGPAGAAPSAYGVVAQPGVAIGGFVHDADPKGPFALGASGTALVADAPWQVIGSGGCADRGRAWFGFVADCAGARDPNGRLTIRLVGSNDDTDRLAAANPAPNVSYELYGGDGRDVLEARGTPGLLDGGAGADTLHAADGVRQRIACGRGADTVVADFLDDVGSNCERVSRK